MRYKYSIFTIIFLIFSTIIAFYFVSNAARKLPFRTNPRYELTAYFISKDQTKDSLFHIYGRLYATFDKNGYCKLAQKYDNRMIFNDFRISEGKINQLNQYFKKMPSNLDLIHNEQPRIYDGPNLRLDYINNDISKTLYFISINDSIYNLVFGEIYSFTIKTKHNTFNDSIPIIEMRSKMLKSIKKETESEFKKSTNYIWDILD